MDKATSADRESAIGAALLRLSAAERDEVDQVAIGLGVTLRETRRASAFNPAACVELVGKLALFLAEAGGGCCSARRCRVSLICEGVANTAQGVRVRVVALAGLSVDLTLAEATALSDALARSVQAFGQSQVKLQQDYLISTDASFSSGQAIGAIHVFGQKIGTWIKRFTCETCLHAELETIRFAFAYVKNCSRVTIYTDSEQAINLLTKYTSVKEPVAAGIVAGIKLAANEKRLIVEYVWKPRASPEIQRVHNICQRAGI